MYHGKHWFRQSHDRLRHGLNENEVILRRLGTHIPTRAERTAIATQSDNPDRGVGGSRLKRRKQLAGELVVNGVEFVRAVQRQRQNTVANF